MSPPDTNTEKEAKRHKGPLMGMVGVVLFALVLLGLLTIYIFARGNEPADGESIGEETTAPAIQGESAPATEAEGQ